MAQESLLCEQGNMKSFLNALNDLKGDDGRFGKDSGRLQ
jgi:hypothetical protein